MTSEESIGALTVAGFCSSYSIGRTFMYQEIKSGRLRACKAGKKTLILLAEAERWAQSLPKLQAMAKANVGSPRCSTSESNPERAAPSES